jgi:DNA repair ATPase RecN
MIQTFENTYKTLEKNLIIAKQNKMMLEKDITDLQAKITSLETMNQCLEKVIIILTQAATTSRDNARAHFEKIITDALQFVSQSKDYEFVIKELTGRAKASYEFYIKSTVNGVECLQKPEDANGGGFVDIISVAAKYAYLEIFNDPRIMSGTLLYDEPGKMISEQMSVKFAEYIKFLGNHYDRQTIMVTHNDNLSNVADKTFVVRKDSSGISTATEQSITAINFIDMEALLNEDAN